jgi:2-polyprenyl-3-methyl-5-hydroxy-6-metoxy-1,4-benzoquinol methylase
MQTPVVDWNTETIGRGADYTRFLLLSAIIREHQTPGSVLDVGCGIGLLRPLLRDFTYTGVDLSQSDIATARASQLGTFVCANADEWEPDESFDVVVFNESLYYLSDFNAALRKYSERIKPGGILAASIFRKGGWRNPTTIAAKIARSHIMRTMKHIKDVSITDGGLTWDIFVARHGST